MSILDALLQPCAKTPGYLPRTPEVYHSLVYTLTNALSQFSLQKYDDKDDILHGHHDMDINEQQVRSGILTILDNLTNGSLIPITGVAWKSYHTRSATTIPNAVANFCVVEALLKSVMMGNCNQTNPYHGSATMTNATERARDRLILEELLPRFWKEPAVDERPAYFKIIFLLTELACETFLMSNIEDLKIKTSVVSLLIPLVVDKLSPTRLQYYLADRDTVETQRMVALNVIVMLLSLLSICSFQDQPQHQPGSTFSSPELRPQPSMPDFASIATSMSTTDMSHDHQSINSFNIHIASDAAMRKLLLTLKSYIEEFWNSGYKDLILAGTESMHQDTSGERSARCFQNLIFHINPTMGEEIVKKTLPSLFKRLVDTYPPAIPSICQMLHEISKRYRSSFFKPVVSCVASDDEEKVSNLLSLITCLRRYMSGVQFWMQDAEMINVLLLSDVGQSKKKTTATSSNSSSKPKVSDSEWGSTTLGQCTIATEFMWAIKEMRDKQRDPHRNMEEDEIAKKFLIDLERRLSVFLTAKEKMALVPMPLRVILCNIFINMRFFCNTTHRPGWLTRVIDWATQPVISTAEHVYHHILPIINPNASPTPNNPPNQCKLARLHTGHIEEVLNMFERINSVYLNVVDTLQFETNDSSNYAGSVPKSTQPGLEDRFTEVPRHKRQQLIHRMYPISRSAALSLDLDPPVPAEDGSIEAPASKLAKYRFENMEKINQDAFGSVFSLLAAVFTTLSSNEFGRLVRPLWECHMDDRKPQSFIPAVFLLMECGEKIPKVMIEVCTHDFYR